MIPSSPVTFWHYFDFITLIAITIVISSLVKAHHKKTGGLLGSISQTVAYSKKSSIIFSIAMTIFFPLYYAYIWFWVLPLIIAPYWLYALLVVSAACEMIFVWVPATLGRSKRVHELAAGVVGIFMWLLPLFILIEGKGIDRLACVSLVLSLLTPFVLLVAVVNERLRKFTFLYETIFCVMFLLALSLVGHA